MEFRLLTYLAIGKQNINSGSCLSSNLHVLPATHHSLLQPAPDKTAIIDIVDFTQVIYSQVYGKLFSTIIILEWVFWWTIELQVISSISRYLTYFTKRLWGLYSKHRTEVLKLLFHRVWQFGYFNIVKWKYYLKCIS